MIWVQSIQADESVSLSLPECQARIERRLSEPDVLLLRSECALSMASLTKLLQVGLSNVWPLDSTATFSISLSRLMQYPQWSRALASAAAHSPSWDANRGRSRNANQNNQVVTDLLNASDYLKSIQPLFSPQGFKVCVAGVEKVLVFKAKDIFSANELNEMKLPANALLPVDAQIWLKLRGMGDDCKAH